MLTPGGVLARVVVGGATVCHLVAGPRLLVDAETLPICDIT